MGAGNVDCESVASAGSSAAATGCIVATFRTASGTGTVGALAGGSTAGLGATDR